MTHGSRTRVGWVLSIALLTGSCSSKGGDEDIGRCPAFKVCGGVPDGSWQIDSACIDSDLAAAFSARWSQPSCQGAVKSNTLSMGGTLTVANGSWSWNVTTDETWRAIYDIACINAMNGSNVVEVDKTQCYVQQARLDQPGIFSSVACSALNQTCECHMTYDATNTNAVAYTIQEATIVFLDGAPPADYCTKNDALALRQADATSGLPVIINAHRI
jgi:hypothetical protein